MLWLHYNAPFDDVLACYLLFRIFPRGALSEAAAERQLKQVECDEIYLIESCSAKVLIKLANNLIKPF